ncbi:tyrosine-type recombinase/integrase [Rhodocyclus gracilis]|uniref:Tyrosine-type recombinase/integrase n=1 Tax=Rhodocyclus tenuis TaxID=1066 RepID=A0A6L5JX79_RHOTE|nr:tyrosine-type recombinase/integrase [Rhodocyclus gracilis]MQY51943.1 tyrosine-type recombinase/integrase [Rhodocyclus gracilis]
MNLDRRPDGVWCATLLVPKDVQQALGKVRFRKSMGTTNKREAGLLAAPFIASWKAQIRQARGSTNAVSTEALRWRVSLAQAPDEDAREIFEHVLTDEAEKVEEAKGLTAAQEFVVVATGAATPSSEYFEAWKAQIKLAPKTKDQMVKDVSLLIAEFSTLESINKGAVRRWVDKLEARGAKLSSVKRILSFCRNYWKYLQRYDAVSKDAEPFAGVIEAAPKKKGKKATNFAYDAADVVKLWEAARARPVGTAKNAKRDTQLADLIMLGAYTGARIESLCSLKTAQVRDGAFWIEDDKTEAGTRSVPIHSVIAPLVERLKKESKDGYLLSGLTFNKYEGRSNAIGKRFGRLKAAEGFSSQHTFHSFRSTVATLLENAGVPEGVAADILGHEKPTMTFGLYSSGADLNTKREALERISYPFKAEAGEN